MTPVVERYEDFITESRIMERDRSMGISLGNSIDSRVKKLVFYSLIPRTV